VKNAAALVMAPVASLNCVDVVVAIVTARIVNAGCAAVLTGPASRTLCCTSWRSSRAATTMLLPSGLSEPRISSQSPVCTSLRLNVSTC
jgi:hypothetical protein